MLISLLQRSVTEKKIFQSLKIRTSAMSRLQILHLLISSECKITLKLRNVIHVGLRKFKYSLCIRKWTVCLKLRDIIFRHVSECTLVGIYVKEQYATLIL
jgi:hypothetical protein